MRGQARCRSFRLASASGIFKRRPLGWAAARHANGTIAGPAGLPAPSACPLPGIGWGMWHGAGRGECGDGEKRRIVLDIWHKRAILIINICQKCEAGQGPCKLSQPERAARQEARRERSDCRPGRPERALRRAATGFGRDCRRTAGNGTVNPGHAPRQGLDMVAPGGRDGDAAPQNARPCKRGREPAPDMLRGGDAARPCKRGRKLR